MSKITLYGLRQCNRCQQLWQRLQQNQGQLTFIDWRKDALNAQGLVQDELLTLLLHFFDWQDLINKRSTSWRNLTKENQQLINTNTVKQLLATTPTLIKRPLLQIDRHFLLGRDAENYL